MKRVVTAVVGGLLVAVGAVLLILPGPGVVVMVAGFAVLARQFEWAARPLRWAQGRAKQGLDLVADRALFAVLDALAALVLIGIGVADLTVGLPVIEDVGDVFVMASGLFLAGTIVYARTRHPHRRWGPTPADRSGGEGGI